jgi:acetyltransferase-like isoleucine patch superfamily enzyme
MNSHLKIIEPIVPSFAKALVKKVINRFRYASDYYFRLEKGRFAEFGYMFRFECKPPYHAVVGERTIVEYFNVWNANNGDIIVGKQCWFGLNNILMGPVVFGDESRTGPYVFILGPRHAVMGYERAENEKTIIGKKVWISTNSIIHFGVTIGDNAIIAPGSVITKDVPAGAYFAGNPARDLTNLIPPQWKEKGRFNSN